MKFFIDTANVELIRSYYELGIIDGVTTNPSLVSKEDGSFDDIIKEISSFVDGPISAEVIATDTIGMISQAEELAAINRNIVVKIPMTKEGIKAVNALSKKSIKTNVTLVFSPAQALLAAKVGAAYVSPFIGRLDDIGHHGMELIEQIRAIYDNYQFATEIIVASIRHPSHVIEAALNGADVATVPPEVIEKLFNHPLTDIGLAKFLEDWKLRFG
ncbi:MAG: fructose-6-phosphate aldolase [Epsilonproteobacteria bacterium]|nr:fructose-6-phosphate aldolase [Campylobacterota bacterium]